MEKKSILNKIKEIYEDGGNIIQYLRGKGNNSIEDIMISYDFQAGSYVKAYYDEPEINARQIHKIIEYIKSLNCSFESIFEGGIGEGTKLIPCLNLLDNEIYWAGGADISWSRVKTAQAFMSKELHKDIPVHLFVGDLFCLPLKNDSVDIVYTFHALEPNGGKEEILLRELYRITKKYLVLFEPSYELACDEGKVRMKDNGYIRDLKKCAEQLGYNIVKYEPFELDINPLNPAAVMIIKKGAINSEAIKDPLCCPVTKMPIKKCGNVYFSEKSLLSYPIVNGVTCLTKDNAVVTTKMGYYNSTFP